MKRSAESLIGYTMGATDGEIGKVEAFFFDDQTWSIRYIVVKTGSWLFGRKVLISPEAIESPEWNDHVLPTNLTKDQIRNSPDIDTEKPVSRQQEIKLNEYYPWTGYWGGGYAGGGMGAPGMVMPLTVAEATTPIPQEKASAGAGENSHLRSTTSVKGYGIHATDVDLGTVDDYILDDKNWGISFLVINTGIWLTSQQVLISPNRITAINWATSTVLVDVSAEQVKNSPEYNPRQPINEVLEKNLYDYYGRPISIDQ